MTTFLGHDQVGDKVWRRNDGRVTWGDNAETAEHYNHLGVFDSLKDYEEVHGPVTLDEEGS